MDNFFFGFWPLHVLTHHDKNLFRRSIAFWVLLGSFSTERVKKIESVEITHMMDKICFFWFRAPPFPDRKSHMMVKIGFFGFGPRNVLIDHARTLNRPFIDYWMPLRSFETEML